MRASDVRFRVDPADVPPEKVARRLHLTPARFEEVRQKLFDRGFPQPDPTTGNYCLEAVDRWRKLRMGVSHLFPELTSATPSAERSQVRSMGERFRETQKRKRHD